MPAFRGRRVVLIAGIALVAILATVLGASILDHDEPDRRRTMLEELSEADLDRIVVQLQDPRFDRLSPSVVDDYRDAVVLAGDDPQGSREPLVVLRSDEGDESVWNNEVLVGGVGAAFLAALLLTWRTVKLWKERRP
jgi:hypothetical protein